MDNYTESPLKNWAEKTLDIWVSQPTADLPTRDYYLEAAVKKTLAMVRWWSSLKGSKKLHKDGQIISCCYTGAMQTLRLKVQDEDRSIHKA